MGFKTVSQILVFLLMIEAAWVSVGLYRKKNMWVFIFWYWVILTAKNAVDFIGMA